MWQVPERLRCRTYGWHIWGDWAFEIFYNPKNGVVCFGLLEHYMRGRFQNTRRGCQLAIKPHALRLREILSLRIYRDRDNLIPE